MVGADQKPRRTTKADKDFAKKLNFKDIKFPVKVRDIHKIEKQEFYHHYCFWLKKQRKISNVCFKIYCRRKNLFIIDKGKEGKGHYVLMKNSNTFMYHHTFLPLLLTIF